MAAIAGTQIMNQGMQAASVPDMSPVLVVPQGKVFDVVGLVLTSLSSVAQTVLVFRDSLALPPIFTIIVSPLAGQPGSMYGPQQQLWSQQLAAGEKLWVVPVNVTAWGLIFCEVDGYFPN